MTTLSQIAKELGITTRTKLDEKKLHKLLEHINMLYHPYTSTGYIEASAEKLSISPATIRSRIHNGMPLEEACTTPRQVAGRKTIYNLNKDRLLPKLHLIKASTYIGAFTKATGLVDFLRTKKLITTPTLIIDKIKEGPYKIGKYEILYGTRAEIDSYLVNKRDR